MLTRLQKLSKCSKIKVQMTENKLYLGRCNMDFRTIAEIENDIQNKQTELDQTTHEIQKSILVNAIAALEAEKKQVAEALSQQNLQERVDQAKVTGYILDDLYTSNGLSMFDLSYSPANHELVAIEVQKAFLAQQDAFNVKENDLNDRLNTSAKQLLEEVSLRDAIQQEKEKLERVNFTLEQEKKEVEQSRDNAVRISEEYQEEIKKQAKKINELLEKQTGSAVPIAPLSAEEKETKLMAEVMGKQIKLINVKPKNEDSLTNKMFTATNAVTGADVEDHYIYLSLLGENKPKRYVEIKIEEAAQLQQDYLNKKAEYELQINIIPIQAESMEYVTEQDEAATDKSPIEEEIRAATFGGTEETEGNAAMDEVVGQNQEGAVITLESLQAQVNAIMAHVGLAA